jgi:modified peptide precursor CbpA
VNISNLMVKGSDSPAWGLSEPFFVCDGLSIRRCSMKKSSKKVIAYRKSCTATGTGLSHYILMDRKAK